jgi:hypothetical protein
VNNRASRYKDIATGNMIRFLSIAVPVDPGCVLNLSQEALFELLKNSLFKELVTPAYALPKKFNLQKVLIDLRVALED